MVELVDGGKVSRGDLRVQYGDGLCWVERNRVDRGNAVLPGDSPRPGGILRRGVFRRADTISSPTLQPDHGCQQDIRTEPILSAEVLVEWLPSPFILSVKHWGCAANN